MDRKELIRLYLEAEATPAQERELAASFAATPPADEAERAVWRMLQAVAPPAEAEPRDAAAVPEAADEFDRIVRRARARSFRTWGLSLAGAAAVLAAVLRLPASPEAPAAPAAPAPAPRDDVAEIVRQLARISESNPADAESYEFHPAGDGFIMTARFPDGQTASFILTPADGGATFDLISLNH